MSSVAAGRKRRLRRFAAIMVGLLLLAVWQIAIAQPPAAKQPAAKQPAAKQPAAKPPAKAPGNKPPLQKANPKAKAPKLPPGHPPINPKRRDPARMEQIRKLLEQQKRAQGKQGAPPAKRKKPKAPRDEHGHCLGQGPDDRPKDINLFHGWLGSKEELGGAEDSAWEKAIRAPEPKGGRDWWIWRLTPYPYRYDNHDDHCDRANQPVPLLANIVNLGALLFILVRFGRKPLAEALKNRKRTIMTDFDKAAEIKSSARERLDDYRDQLDHLDDKLESLRAQYVAEGENEEARVRREATERLERMLADADFRVSQEGKTARDDLSREALEEALAAAEKMVIASVGPADQARIAEEYLDQVGDALKSATRDGGQS